MPDGFGFGFGPSIWDFGAYLTGRGRLSGEGFASGNLEGSYVQVRGSGQTSKARYIEVTGIATVSGTASLAPRIRGYGELAGYSTTGLSGRGTVVASGGGTGTVSGTANVSVTNLPANVQLDPDETWKVQVKGSARVSGSGTTTGEVRGAFYVRGVRVRGTTIGYGPGGFFAAPRLGLTGGTAEAVGGVSIPTQFTGITRVTGEAQSSAAGSKAGSGTVTDTPAIWASGRGDVSLTGYNVRIW